MADIFQAVTYDDVLRGNDGAFSAENAVALLLRNSALFLSGNWLGTVEPDGSRLLVNCSDVFVWGGEDHEELRFTEIEALFRFWRKGPVWGPAIWCMVQRREMPQDPVETAIRAEGVWNLDVFRAANGLRANRYDGISAIRAGRQYELYSTWEAQRGLQPPPFDAEWWQGWRRYEAEHPNWCDEVWQTECDRLSNIWLRENGFETE